MSEKKDKNVSPSNNKFANIYQRFIIAMSERRKGGIRNYFKKISLNTTIIIFLFITVFSFVYTGYYDVLADQPNRVLSEENIKIVFYIPYVTIMALSFVLLKPNKIFSLMYYIIPAIITVFTVIYFIKIEAMVIIFTSFLGVMLGIVTVGAIYIFLFDLNTSEQLIGAIMLTTVICGFHFLNSIFDSFTLPVVVTHFVVPTLFLLFAYILLFFVDASEYKNIEVKEEKIPLSSVVLIIAILAIVLINDGIFVGIKANMTMNSYFSVRAYTLGFLMAIIFSVAIFIYMKNAIYVLIICYFICAIGTYEFGLFYLLFENSGFLRNCFEGAMGITSSIGIILCVMMVGKVLEDKTSLKILQLFALFIPLYVLGSRFLSIGIKVSNLSVVLVISICIMIVIFSMLLALNIKAALAVRAIKNTPVSEIERNMNKYKQIDPEEVLTKKEKIIFDLLLEGLTLRQIAGELSLKYDTVNFHYKNIYRKLNVNSKIELILRYGDALKSDSSVN